MNADDRALRAQLIRLASSQPELRAALLPILRDVRSAAEAYSLRYRTPGKGGWKEKPFKDEVAAKKFVEALREKEGDDVQVEWPEATAKTAKSRRKMAGANR